MTFQKKVLYAFFVSTALLLIHAGTVSAQTLPSIVIFEENFEGDLNNWTVSNPAGCTIRTSAPSEHAQYNTPISPYSGSDLLISRESGNFECYISYFPTEELKKEAYISLYFYDNLGETNDLNFLSVVKNYEGDAVSLAVRKQFSTDEYVLRINTEEYKTGIKRTKGWQFFEFLLENNEIHTRLNNNDLLNYPYPDKFADIIEVRFGAGWNTKQAARIDGLIVKRKDRYIPYCNDFLCNALNLPINIPLVDTIALWEENGKLRELITSGGSYWYRDDINNNDWQRGVLFENEVNNTGTTFPSSLDSNVVYSLNGKLTQIITKENKFWYRGDTTGPWTSSGQILSNAINNTNCEIPAKLDANSIYKNPTNASLLSQVMVYDSTYWYRADTTGPWTECGQLVPGLTEKVEAHTRFLYQGNQYDIVYTANRGWIIKNLIYTNTSNNSSLWGKEGELWNPLGRLPDFSYAGYHAGEKNIPLVPVKTNVKDFGAKGDGTTDDTNAFKQAIANTENGAVLIPKGRYKITDVLFIQKNNIVLRGEGSGEDGSVLVFPDSLTDMLGDNPYYVWGNGGVIWFGYKQKTGWIDGVLNSKVSEVVGEYKRGDKVIRVNDSSKFKVGDYITIKMVEVSDLSMQTMLHGGEVDDDIAHWQPSDFVWTVMITAINGQSITLKQPLRVDINQKWKPIIYIPNLYTEVGIEHLKIEFPELPTTVHHEEKGYNALEFRGILNGWINDVSVQNADNGPAIILSKHISILNLRHVLKNRTPNDFGWGNVHGLGYGHHGISFLVGSSDNLMSGYKINRFLHDITMQGLVNGNVIKNSSGQDLSLDHHGDIPYENLFSNLDMGIGYRTYSSTGTISAGPHSGARETFWNLKYNDPKFKAYIPDIASLFPQSTIIGANVTMNILNNNVFMEKIENIEPVELYDSQFKARMKREGIQIFQKGDINEDGNIDAVDFGIYTMAIFGNQTEYDWHLVDIFEDGRLNIIDIVNML